MILLAYPASRLIRRRSATAALRASGVACAALLMLFVRLDHLEQARNAPEWTEAMTGTQEFAVVITGFPETSTGLAGRTVRVAARLVGERTSTGALLWIDSDDEGRPTAETARNCDGETASSEGAPGAGVTGCPPGIESWGPGTRLRVGGTLAADDPASSTGYSLNVSALGGVSTTTADPIGVMADSIGKVAARVRSGLRTAASAHAGAELVPGFAVGDTSLVSEQLEQQMLQSSLTHLVAVSGANCALITASVLWAARRLGAGRRTRTVLAGSALLGFVILVGPDASVQRAAVMAAVVLVSDFGGRRAQALPSLGIAVLGLLVANPWQALDAGFALSVAATLGILLLAPLLRRTSRRRLRIPDLVALPLAVTASAQIACGPFLLLLQPDLPVGGLLANLLAGPAAPWGTGLGLLAALTVTWAPLIGHTLLVLASVPAQWIAATAEVAADLPFTRWAWPGGWGGAALLAGVECAFLLAWGLASGQVTVRGERSLPRAPWADRGHRSRRVRRATALLMGTAAGVTLATTLVAPLTSRLETPRDWFYVACDIGQGDATLLRDPSTPSEIVLVDTGDDPELLTACLDRFGVRHIAQLVLTHDDRDHVGALAAVADRVDRVLIAPPNLETGDRRPLLTRLSGVGLAHPEVAERGATGHAGRLSWRVLAPPVGARPADTNAASIILSVETGPSRILLLADAGEDEQRALRRLPDTDADLRGDIVKVSHHGSRDRDPELLCEVGAELGTVSVGAENTYGHPAPETMQNLANCGTRGLRTDRLGSIAVSGGPGSFEIWAEHGE